MKKKAKVDWDRVWKKLDEFTRKADHHELVEVEYRKKIAAIIEAQFAKPKKVKGRKKN